MGRRILIIQTEATDRIALKAMLGVARYDVIQAAGGAEAMALLREGPAALIICDMDMPDMDAKAFCARLSALGHDAPAVLVLARGNDAHRRLDVLRAGAGAVLARPCAKSWLLAHIRSLLRARDAGIELRRRETTASRFGFAEAAPGFAPSPRCVLIEDAPQTGAPGTGPAADCAGFASGVQRRLFRRMSPEEALGQAEGAGLPDVYLLQIDGDDPEAGLALLAELRSHPATRHAAILVLHGPEAREAAGRALDLGANDLFDIGWGVEELQLRIRAQAGRKREADRLRDVFEEGLRLAARDALTGLFNRRYAMPHLEQMLLSARREKRHLAVMMIDVDHFKKVNDDHGHQAGDLALAGLAARLRENLRAADLTARIGGEEFLVALPDTTCKEAHATAERLRLTIGATPIPLPGGAALCLSVSIGVALSNAITGPAAALVDLADQALYRAKSGGRDRVTMAPALPPPVQDAAMRPAPAAPPPAANRSGMTGKP
ncbi:diguanylate cyclase [Profundibacterium mesophilum]|uniref:diguanylate cyclase n=1 Tax=Profundibacterium mesophilum KAUST100406-0324 TaxID=1037889 RepID=A0A921TER7_9RHOB|nr:diguanylate cyclase [Profundibacterium mesophilum]KAF0677581.1 Two component response regulator [Profundibacterium mesophilum KAUST100406-0324]